MPDIFIYTTFFLTLMKKKVYVSHSQGFDYKNELYKPIRKSSLNQEYDIILPHEKSDKLFSSKGFFKTDCNILVVEASYPKIGVGIEAGWADAYNVPIITMYKKGYKLSNSIQPMSKAIIQYESIEDMIAKLEKALSKT